MIDPIYVDLGEEIRKRREALGMTQSALAKSLGLARTSITNIEGGRQPLQVHQLYRMAAVLRAGVTDLLPQVDFVMRERDREPSQEIISLLTKLDEPVGGTTP